MTTPLRIILTDDGGTVRGWPTPPTREAIENYVGGYADQGVDVLSYGLVGAHMATYDSGSCTANASTNPTTTHSSATIPLYGGKRRRSARRHRRRLPQK